jgi:hypothetical protein
MNTMIKQSSTAENLSSSFRFGRGSNTPLGKKTKTKTKTKTKKNSFLRNVLTRRVSIIFSRRTLLYGIS